MKLIFLKHKRDINPRILSIWPSTWRPKGFSYVTFSSKEEAVKALLELNRQLVDRRVVIRDTTKVDITFYVELEYFHFFEAAIEGEWLGLTILFIYGLLSFYTRMLLRYCLDSEFDQDLSRHWPGCVCYHQIVLYLEQYRIPSGVKNTTEEVLKYVESIAPSPMS
ncbi:hypothetical protein Bca52824_032053 [Brassica carinata]|uniref:RRM domain-containing protein n=1 Tax=Brassica carinata TaxID=52824 RepID=A0A8X7SCC0_BRACI|nr:hypothetical protein Bca52824_032053 [Brassica carinata]